MPIIGPNTNIDSIFIKPNIVICSGEDTNELLSAIKSFYDLLSYCEYKCYRFWNTDKFTVCWTGFGTGCLEPLLFELFTHVHIVNCILIGTAGRINTSLDFDSPFYVERASLAGTPLDNSCSDYVYPKFKLPLNYNSATLLSTDLFYAYQGQGNRFNYTLAPQTQTRFKEKFSEADLIDMETGQFFYFCQHLPKITEFEYLALKTPVNIADNPSSMVMHSQRSMVNLIQELSQKILI